MAFPTIPTAGANTLLATPTTTASTTHTFPSLTTLAPQAGDLLIAICVQYSGTSGGSPNDQFSGWGAGFTETRDDETTTANDLAVGVAHKVATGSESGTFTVTSAFAARSVNFLMRIPAGTWDGTTIPEVLAVARASLAVPDPDSFNPSWAAEDTLWIAVHGHSETTTTGSPPIITASPTNYSGDLIVARNADAVGHITAGVGFRQLNADAEDAGIWAVTNAIRGNGASTLIAVRPVPPPPVATATLVGRVSLASGSAPSVDTGHSIKVRVRKTSGTGTVTFSAALYEGATNRSGDLTTSALTTSLAEYTLAIPEASAANITDYSNLELRFWGDSPTGDIVNIEVAEIWLETPESAGVQVAVPITVHPQVTTSGVKNAKASVSLTNHPTLSSTNRKDATGTATTTVKPALVRTSRKGGVGATTKTFHPALTNSAIKGGTAAVATTVHPFLTAVGVQGAAQPTAAVSIATRLTATASGNKQALQIAAITTHPTLTRVSRKGALRATVIQLAPTLIRTSHKGGLVVTTNTYHPALTTIVRKGALQVTVVVVHPSLAAIGVIPAQSRPEIIVRPILTAAGTKAIARTAAITFHPALTRISGKIVFKAVALQVSPTFTARGIKGVTIVAHVATIALGRKGALAEAIVVFTPVIAVTSTAGQPGELVFPTNYSGYIVELVSGYISEPHGANSGYIDQPKSGRVS